MALFARPGKVSRVVGLKESRGRESSRARKRIANSIFISQKPIPPRCESSFDFSAVRAFVRAKALVYCSA